VGSRRRTSGAVRVWPAAPAVSSGMGAAGIPAACWCSSHWRTRSCRLKVCRLNPPGPGRLGWLIPACRCPGAAVPPGHLPLDPGMGRAGDCPGGPGPGALAGGPAPLSLEPGGIGRWAQGGWPTAQDGRPPRAAKGAARVESPCSGHLGCSPAPAARGRGQGREACLKATVRPSRWWCQALQGVLGQRQGSCPGQAPWFPLPGWRRPAARLLKLRAW